MRISDLTTGRLTWRELSVYLDGLPRDSATVRELNPDADWGLPEQLLAASFDALQVANWQRGGDKRNRPKPVPRPGVKSDGDKVGKATRDPDQVRAFLASIAPAKEE